MVCGHRLRGIQTVQKCAALRGCQGASHTFRPANSWAAAKECSHAQGHKKSAKRCSCEHQTCSLQNKIQQPEVCQSSCQSSNSSPCMQRADNRHADSDVRANKVYAGTATHTIVVVLVAQTNTHLAAHSKSGSKFTGIERRAATSSADRACCHVLPTHGSARMNSQSHLRSGIPHTHTPQYACRCALTAPIRHTTLLAATHSRTTNKPACQTLPKAPTRHIITQAKRSGNSSSRKSGDPSDAAD